MVVLDTGAKRDTRNSSVTPQKAVDLVPAANQHTARVSWRGEAMGQAVKLVGFLACYARNPQIGLFKTARSS